MSLKIRTILILCIVFILSQMITLIIFEHNRDNVVLSTEATDLADRVIGIVDLAYSFPQQDRQQILAAAETQFLSLFPDIISITEVACQQNDFTEQISTKLNRGFAKLQNIDAQVCVRSFKNTPLLDRRTTLRQGFDVLIQINFANEQKVTFHSVLPESQSLLQDSVIFYILLEGIVALMLAWYLIQKTVAPIEKLANAANHIGMDINNPPLDESGAKEISMAAKAFNTMQERLANLLHSQSEMLSAISHDLRSAVTRLQLRSDLLENEHERTGMLNVVADMRQMIQSVLDFLRGHNPDEPMRSVNLNALVESLCTDLADEGLPVDYQYDGSAINSAINLTCRPTEIRRCLQNIIDNAIKYANAAQVSISMNNNYAAISIVDKGVGIPEDQLKLVLRPFYRLEQSRSLDTGGIGLGLSIADNIVKSHGGKLTLTNHIDGGLKVEIQLPLNS
jgi:signal transduction histidine kinase